MRIELDKEDLFWLGNIIGIIALLITIFLVAPYKERERRRYEHSLPAQSEPGKSGSPAPSSSSPAPDKTPAPDR